MQEKMKQVEAKVAECIKLAEKTFGIKMPKVDVRFDLRGRAAGIAGCMNRFGSNPTYYLRFNREHMALGGKSWDHIINDTVPHEVAHTVCQAHFRLGKNHNSGWKAVCFALGGNGQRCYSDADAPEAIAKAKPYVYITTAGREVRVSPTVHKKIQRGASYRYRGGLGTVSSACEYKHSTTPTVSKPVEKATKPATKTVTKKTVSNNGSKADQIRAKIKLGWSFDEVVDFGVNELGMKRTLAKTYTTNNWNKA